VKQRALQLLRLALDDREAEFRSGQWECIEALLKKRRLLVVQRTGWGKSIVYFLATCLLREKGAGATLLVSPLLALMRNQIQAAERLGMHAASINSSNTDEWQAVQTDLLNNKIDMLLISPERLANEEFRENVLLPVAETVGLFVVDEAHCISDWGHDFRPDYRRIVRVLNALPSNIPVLATTATANDRVIQDVSKQLGDLQIVRGPLVRTSLKLQNIWLPGYAERLAWLAENLPSLPGSGIVYVLTIRDAERVAAWLKGNGIDVASYHARSENRVELEERLLQNDVKALVATVALGMGFDKPDLGFVIHFQRPGSVVHYYQQVGRAGRALDEAYGVLLGGSEDQEITDYFIRTAFPPLVHVEVVLAALNQAENGLSVSMMEHRINLRRSQIQKTLKFLAVETPAPVLKDGSRWYATPIKYRLDTDKIKRLSELRQAEQQQMIEYMRTGECLMGFICQALDDPEPEECGRCSNCLGKPLLSTSVSPALANEAALFLGRSRQSFPPRKQWPKDALSTYGFGGYIRPDSRAEEGRALCLWGDTGWGELVRDGKYKSGRFADELVDGCVRMINEWSPVPTPTWLTCVPSSTNPGLVADFAARLASRLAIPFTDCVSKTRQNRPQKEMQNSFQQARNLDGVFEVNNTGMPAGPVFLIDDMVDSRWTLTVIAALLRKAGCPAVFPIALALTSLGRG